MEINSKIRRIFIFIDFSEIMKIDNIKPNLIFITFLNIKEFIIKYFDSNPLSKISLSLIKNQSLLNLINFKNNKEECIKIIEDNYKLLQKNFEASINKYLNLVEENQLKLENNISIGTCLKYSFKNFEDMPNYYYKDILIISGSTSTVDNFDIFNYSKKLKKKEIIINSINLSNEWFFLNEISNNYFFCKTKEDFETSLDSLIFPKNINLKNNKFWDVIFPRYNNSKEEFLCSCHNKLIKNGYFCNQCETLNCEIDKNCEGCNYLLLSSYTIFNYYENINIKFQKVVINLEDSECNYCNLISENSFYNCFFCKNISCEDCYLYITKVLKYCIYCN